MCMCVWIVCAYAFVCACVYMCMCVKLKSSIIQNAASVGPQLTSLREIQCLVCSYLHQVFIADPNMAKLVHFQTYPLHLLPMTTAGIPSMHICLDFLVELLAQPQLDKQVTHSNPHYPTELFVWLPDSHELFHC